MTMNEALAVSGEAYGVIELDGSSVEWFPTWQSAELARYKNVVTPEAKAELHAKRVAAMAKARAVRMGKKAEIKRKQVDVCPGCRYTLSLCICTDYALTKKKFGNIYQTPEGI